MPDCSTLSVPLSFRGPHPLDNIIGWDIGNWSRCLSYWQPWLGEIPKSTGKVLVLGERNGGISLWFALLGFEVICTDYYELDKNVGQLHQRWQVQEHITYATADIFNLPYPENQFDLVACKSVIGGLLPNCKDRTTRTLENQKLATEEVRRVLKRGGFFFGAENLTGTRLHMALRKKRHKENLGWRYLELSEIRWLFDGYSNCELKPYGFLGTRWGNFPRIESTLRSSGRLSFQDPSSRLALHLFHSCPQVANRVEVRLKESANYSAKLSGAQRSAPTLSPNSKLSYAPVDHLPYPSLYA